MQIFRLDYNDIFNNNVNEDHEAWQATLAIIDEGCIMQ
jgi:hypothetical protein